jgi:hypothetical protein
MLSCRLVCASLVLTVCMICCWQAASAGPGLFAGATLPVGTFGDAWKTGFNVGLEMTTPVTPMAGIGLWGAYHRLTFDSAVTGHEDMAEVLAVARLTPPAGILVLGGVGFTYAKSTFTPPVSVPENPIAAPEGASSTDFTAAAGLGFSMAAFRLTGLYHSVSHNGGSNGFVTVTLGVGF